MTVRSNVTLNRVGPPVLSRTEQNTLLSAAAMAPSVFNTQPWQFAINGPTVEVYADSDRALYWSVDPFGRQAVVSCGTALLNLRVAAAYLGRDVDVVVNPSASDGLLATVTLGSRGRGSQADAELFPAIRRRHTHRGPANAFASVGFGEPPVQGAGAGGRFDCRYCSGSQCVSESDHLLFSHQGGAVRRSCMP